MPVVARLPLVPISILNVLPNELTIHIIALCDPKTHAALCRVSKLFWHFAEPKMYEVRAAWVINLSIDTGNDSDILRSLNDILRRTKELSRLCLRILDTHSTRFQTWSFPQLRTFSLTFLHSKDHTANTSDFLVSFLNRHPGLSRLSLHAGESTPALVYLPSLNLPNLIAFKGTHSILNSSPKLRSVKVRFNKSNGQNALNNLSRFGACDAVAVEGEWDLNDQDVQEIFSTLKQQVPHLTTLTIRLFIPDSRPDFASTIAEHLQGFTHIQSFGFFGLRHCLYASEQHRDSLLESWVEACPTLQECMLWTPFALMERFRVVNRKPEPTELCWMEHMFAIH
ncbi:hypothetical protein C8J56DRAFT_1057525 [Mycena floridula]|nr:hypothetical protein C8J56DRAFT_1057525 [Mycena floridula]